VYIRNNVENVLQKNTIQVGTSKRWTN